MQEAKKSLSGHYRTTLSGYIFATKARVNNRKKLVKQQYLFQMSPQYGELRPTSGWDMLASLRHPCKFQQVSRLGSVTAWQSSSGRQPNFAALNRGHHLCSAGRPSHWALAHILVLYKFYTHLMLFCCFIVPPVFIMQCYASMVYAMALCLSIYLSIHHKSNVY